MYGENVRQKILEADNCFCTGLHLFPRDGTSCIYCGPTNYGPMNLLWEQETEYYATMIGFPYDNLFAWRSPYPKDVFARAFREMCAYWKAGLDVLEQLEPEVKSDKLRNFHELKNFAAVIYTHFKSSSNQIEFILARKNGEFARTSVEDEITQAMTLFRLQKGNPRIGFEASNHYYYTPNALMEKVLSCQKILEKNSK